MIVTMNRQDLQGAVDYAKDRIIARLITKDDLFRASMTASDRIIEDLHDIRKANLPYIKQNIAITEQVNRRAQNLESRLLSIEHQIKDLVQSLNRIVGQQQRTVSTLQRF